MGKGGEQTVSTEIPEFLQAAAEKAINLATKQGEIGYVPYQGPTVAAFAPGQTAAMDNVASAASAFGMGGGSGSSIGKGAGLPKPTTFAGGLKGYSPFDLFMEAWNKVPDWQRKKINSFQKKGGGGNGGGSSSSSSGKTPIMDGFNVVGYR